MSLNLFLGRIHCLHPSLATSDAATQASTATATPHFTVDFLIQSCGLSSDKAHKASRYIKHFKSLDKPTAVLQFLRDTGVSESDITTAVARDSRILCSHVEKNLRPNIAKLQELGFSIHDISGIISRCTRLFRLNFVSKIDSWLVALGSAEHLLRVLKYDPGILDSSFENVIMPNLSFLQVECHLTVRQIVRLLVSCPRFITARTEHLKMKAEEAEQLGIARSSGIFLYALIVVCRVSRTVRDERMNNFRNHGFSHEDVTRMISKAPYLVTRPEEVIRRNMQFLIKEAGCDIIDVVRNPSLLMYSLENRLIPRTIVRKLLMLNGVPIAHRAFASFMCPTETKFVKKFILPYEHAIPGLHQAYADASTGNIREKMS